MANGNKPDQVRVTLARAVPNTKQVLFMDFDIQGPGAVVTYYIDSDLVSETTMSREQARAAYKKAIEQKFSQKIL